MPSPSWASAFISKRRGLTSSYPFSGGWMGTTTVFWVPFWRVHSSDMLWTVLSTWPATRRRNTPCNRYNSSLRSSTPPQPFQTIWHTQQECRGGWTYTSARTWIFQRLGRTSLVSSLETMFQTDDRHTRTGHPEFPSWHGDRCSRRRLARHRVVSTDRRGAAAGFSQPDILQCRSRHQISRNCLDKT
jgi:hypothetical protein